MNIDYQKDCIIDESALDIECLMQPRLTLSYNAEVAKWERKVSEIKEELDMERAELTKAIMSNPEKYGLAKTTVDAVNSVILVEESYRTLQDELIATQYELKMAQAAKAGIQDKKSMLELLVKLHGQNYFAGPNLPRDISEEYVRKAGNRESNKRIKIKRK